MNRLAVATGILALAAPLALAQTSTWVSDPAHSEVDFSITHMSISNVHGRFGKVNATINYNEADVTKSTVAAMIDVSTLDTGEPARDTHVKSPDFFDAANLSTATFTSTSVAKSGTTLTITGNLTLHGVTKPVVLKLEEPGKSQVGMDGKSVHRGFTATTTINRTDFGLSWNGSLKSGDAMLGNDVRIELDIEGSQI